jgi:hypothetical protein
MASEAIRPVVGPQCRATCGLASGPSIAGRSGNGFADSRRSLSFALAALIAVIGAKRARRSPEGRSEARGRPCPHDACAGGRGRAGFMKNASGR